ncbi:lytic transglycosylase domain-containing protein [Novosphingobium sp. 1Y9A]|uniref:Lytic transglycosylase domain-containing protein n=1 Tax=Novosphingobium jiangmenense TaxID=2791981 RepID=A0ABS0HID3_9SPHN|nr:lytic transglycosylase domain-containing protein [Novosphingobium jiangmenense]
MRSAIAGAAQATGTDFAYLMAQARLESSLDPSARSRTSSASGLYQFTTGTWLRTLEKHGAEHGLAWASDMIRSGAASDPATRAQLLALRFDPQVAATMAGELAGDNSDFLTGVLGRQPDHAELYVAHFFGAEGAGRFLGALASDPSQSAASILPSAASANRSTFYDRSGNARTVGEVMNLIRTRMAGASEGATGDEALQWPASMGVTPATAPVQQFTGGPIAQEFQSAAASTGNPLPVAASSMADTLRQAFALNDGASAPAHVRQAYGRLSALGL